MGDESTRSTEILVDRLRGVDAELIDLAVAVRRIAAHLHPAFVDHAGLVPALEELAEEVVRGSGVSVRINTVGSPGRLGPHTARSAYRIAQESLRNVVRHSGAQAATIELIFGNHDLRLSVQDDGRGFDSSVTRKEGLGLAILRERALIVGGTISVHSRLGHGTTIDATLPLAARFPTTSSGLPSGSLS